MLDRVGLAPGEALAAGEVVEELGVLRVRRDQVPRLVGRFVVPPLLVEPSDRGPELPAGRRVDLPRRAPATRIVVPGSSANAVRFTPGRAKTNVPAGASTRSPSSSNLARPLWTK